ncbi:C2 domain-containing protein At1g53590-like [Impatiens glandulifera]|uniref:C2 domain-containing protein At1g53590-like n=1 Tax=Impatiens glandulifera TaxID=253017 RepID=UPI001FB16909|nr:C2 domain-containing protein At1g53590-like [Impatiens glandulifera]XP_047333886.1 C2 domain-containing protein At1g53590-like [Impatiens glandulifera]XP_047333887.1 C2 domain-containing protein At1g53590-like [Impatiens glandulifera]
MSMDITEVTILHHVALVLLLLWWLTLFDRCNSIAYLLSFIYLYLVHDRYLMRLKKKLQFDERRQNNQRRVLCDSETVRWLNYAVEKMWTVCMEQIVSQKILLPIVPWFLQKYKPWTAKEAAVQSLYMGRSPPVFTEMRVLRQSTGDDHLVLELGMNFLTADDMSGILAVKLRKRLGFGMVAKLHLTGMHIEGKVMLGVKFLRHWPFLGRLRLCFVEPPYFQMTVKPLFSHGLDVTEVPGIAGWLDNLLALAFEQTLVEPNMLVVDMEKFVSPQEEPWFSVNEKEPLAYALVEVIEAADMKPSDLNGLADPYVKGQLGPYRFRTKTHKKTLSPKWHEEFKIPIFTWESPNTLSIEVRDKDHFVDDILGDCSVNITEFRGGQRNDMWLPLQNIKMGRLHLAITVIESQNKMKEELFEDETLNEDYEGNSSNDPNQTTRQSSFSSKASEKSPRVADKFEKSPRVADKFEPIDIDGQDETGIWVHQPGSEIPQIWEPRKGRRSGHLDPQTNVEGNEMGSFQSGSPREGSSTDESMEGNKEQSKNKIMRGLQKIGGVFNRSNTKKDYSSSVIDEVVPPSPHVNLKPVNRKNVNLKLVVDKSDLPPSVSSSDDKASPEGEREKNMKGIIKHAGKSAARSLKHVLSRKGSKLNGEAVGEVSVDGGDSDSSVEETLMPIDEGVILHVVSNPTPTPANSSFKSKEITETS